MEVFGSNAPQMTMEHYETIGFKYGILGSDWEANLFMNNVTDARGQLYHDVTDFEPFWGRQRTSVVRPREYGIRFTKHWE